MQIQSTMLTMPALENEDTYARVTVMEETLTRMQEQLQDVEGIVDQLNDTSTQPGAQITIDTCKQVELAEVHEKITAVEKQLHAAIGAKIKEDAAGGKQPQRVPTVQ